MSPWQGPIYYLSQNKKYIFEDTIKLLNFPIYCHNKMLMYTIPLKYLCSPFPEQRCVFFFFFMFVLSTKNIVIWNSSIIPVVLFFKLSVVTIAVRDKL